MPYLKLNFRKNLNIRVQNQNSVNARTLTHNLMDDQWITTTLIILIEKGVHDSASTKDTKCMFSNALQNNFGFHRAIQIF